MKKFVVFTLMLALFASCSSVVVPNYIVDYSDKGREERRLEEERIAAEKAEKRKARMQGYSDEGESDVSQYIAKKEIKVDRDKCIRIVQISDFHSAMFGSNEDTLIQKIKDASPDLIVLTGDIFDFETKYARPVEHVRYLIDGIKDIAPFYYVSGNHEFYAYHEEEFNYIITDRGGIVIEGKALALTVPLGKIILAGLPDPFIDLSIEERRKAKDNKEKYLERISALKSETEALKQKMALAGEKVLCTVLLAHRPEYIDDYKKAGCFDLVLSGHTHGGLWKFGKIIKGVYAPNQGFFPKYAGGLYEFFDEEKPSALVISRGLSYQKPAIPRIGNNPELVVIDIVPHESRF